MSWYFRLLLVGDFFFKGFFYSSGYQRIFFGEINRLRRFALGGIAVRQLGFRALWLRQFAPARTWLFTFARCINARNRERIFFEEISWSRCFFLYGMTVIRKRRSHLRLREFAGDALHAFRGALAFRTF